MSKLFSLPQLPPMQCDDGCGECCTIVPVSASEFRRIKGVVDARGITPIKQGITCPMFIGGKCSIYEARPALCRLFGHCEGMVCTRGYNANTDKATERKYQEAMLEGGTGGMATLHQLAYSQSEFEAMLAEVDPARTQQ